MFSRRESIDFPLDHEALRPWDRLSTTTRHAGEHFERPPLFTAEPSISVLIAIAPGFKLGRDGYSFQLGRASAPMIPQRVNTVRGPKLSTVTSFGHDATPSTGDNRGHALSAPVEPVKLFARDARARRVTRLGTEHVGNRISGGFSGGGKCCRGTISKSR
jgi:hypothetical protein